MLVFEEVVDFVGHLQADIRQVGQHLWQRLLHTGQAAQRAGQYLGGFFAHVGNAQGIDEARQARALAGFDGIEQLLAGDLGKAFKPDNLLELQFVQVSWRADQAFITNCSTLFSPRPSMSMARRDT